MKKCNGNVTWDCYGPENCENCTNYVEARKDYLGNDLFVGDEVVFMQIDYRSLMKGILVSTTGEKQGTIKHDKTNTYKTESRQYYNQMIKISK